MFFTIGKDKSLGVGWQRNRGVMAAIEEYFGTKFNENASFTDVRKGWIVRHNALCSGFTVLERLNFSNGNAVPARMIPDVTSDCRACSR